MKKQIFLGNILQFIKTRLVLVLILYTLSLYFLFIYYYPTNNPVKSECPTTPVKTETTPVKTECPIIKAECPSPVVKNTLILDNLNNWRPEVFISRTRTNPDFLITGPVSEQGMDLSHIIRREGVWARSETLIFKEILNDRCLSDDYGKNPLVLDAGANVGYFSMLSAALKCRVISIEPIPDPIFYFNLSAHLNQHMNRMTIYHGAISDRTGTIYVKKRPDQDSSIAKISEDGDGTAVPSLVLSDLIKEDLILLKVDIEGFEDLAIKGLEPSFEKYKIENIIMEIKQERDITYKIQFINKMMERGYLALSYREGGLSLQGIECEYLNKLENHQWIPWEDVWFIKIESKTWKKVKDKLTCRKSTVNNTPINNKP